MGVPLATRREHIVHESEFDVVCCSRYEMLVKALLRDCGAEVVGTSPSQRGCRELKSQTRNTGKGGERGGDVGSGVDASNVDLASEVTSSSVTDVRGRSPQQQWGMGGWDTITIQTQQLLMFFLNGLEVRARCEIGFCMRPSGVCT